MQNLPGEWTANSTDAARDDAKRTASPSSFFYSQGRSLVLAAQYFRDDRLTESARSGVAKKHRHRIHLALYGQLMASFEYLLKDFVARAIDVTDLYDERLKKAKWVDVDVARVLGSRITTMSVGAMLIHPTLGWHHPEQVNARYEGLFQYRPIQEGEVEYLNRLWILRHTVAHNAGFLTAHDAARLGASSLSEKVVAIDDTFISEAFDFLRPTARRIAEEIGGRILNEWLSTRVPEPNYVRDAQTYAALKHLATCLESRPGDLPDRTEADYLADQQAAQAAQQEP